MSRVVVCTDSSALLSAHDVARLGIEVVPIALTLDGEPVRGDLDADEFYARMAAGVSVATSQPSPMEFAAAYAALAARGVQSVLSIHLDERVSGTAASAASAARDATIPVRVVAIETVSFGVGLCVRTAAEAMAAGATARAAETLARTLGSTVRNVFVAPGAPAGRVSQPADWTVLTFAAGETRPLAACESITDAVEVMVEHILKAVAPIRVAVGHAAAATEPAATDLAAALAESDVVAELERYRVGPPVGAHSGPLSFGAFWWPE
ncbi:MAG: DegV family protein [Gaiellaceae bacterium MAG52_C11]|nr:DegV family protein [Candidatus Gaiellasilicea maunaloa]